MTETARRSPATTAVPVEDRPVQGPVLIDPQLLKHISGGNTEAPKGGWTVPQAVSSTEAPKGGWA